MTKQLQDAYIVAATRTPVGKAPRGVVPPHAARLRCSRTCCRACCAQVPQLDASRIEDVIVGCAMPEYEQGMNIARIGRAARRAAEHGRRG